MSSIFFRTLVIFILLTAAMRFMGKREIGELEVGELITTLLISEICSIPIDDPDIPLLNAVVPVIFIVSLEIILSFIKNKSARLKKFFEGKPVFLISRGKIIQSALRDNRISLEEFFAAIRQSGTGKLSDVEYCVLEANGKISVLSKSCGFDRIVISDGEIRQASLKALGLSDRWLMNSLGKTKPSDVFLMAVDEKKQTVIIEKEKKN